MKTIDMFVL